MLDEKKIWQNVLADLEMALPRASFKTWFQNTFISKIEPETGTAVISVPNAFTKSWLEKKYCKEILRSLASATDSQIKKAKYEIGGTMPKKTEPSIEKEEILEKISLEEKSEEKVNAYGLNEDYVFSRFIVGKENELAHAASLAASKYPGKKYNPLFIYGGVGLGKTHLLHAVGHALLETDKKLKIACINAERFTNDFIKAIRGGAMDKFRKGYRNLDVLLIDDIQFLAGKEGTQEEFFHTFNILHQDKKQIVLTSDRPPKAIPALEDRLVSRFEWGLIADIVAPGIEMKTAILKAKCVEKQFSLSDEILSFLAGQVTTNIRELEGLLNRLMAYRDFHNLELDLPVARSIISSLSTSGGKGLVRLKEVLDAVADFYNIKIVEIMSQSRKKELVEPRQVAMYLLREDLKLSFPLIGKELGKRDHTTVMHAYDKIQKEIAEGGRRKQEVDFIKQKLYGRH